MPCDHRFINKLYPTWKYKYLFVGTFNPQWDRPKGDNANYFYGRRNNDFWYIMPQVFGHPSLMLPQFRNDPDCLERFCINYQIGITDLIESIQDADINNPSHFKIITNVKDSAFDIFNDINPTSINDLIENQEKLCEVYLTRQTDSLKEDNIINNLWENVVDKCTLLEIHHSELITPSRIYRRINRDQKLDFWREVIQICKT